MVPRDEARVRSEGERPFRFGEPLQTLEASEGFLDVPEERGRWWGGGTDAGTDRQKGSPRRRQQGWLRAQSKERQPAGEEEEPHGEIVEEGYSLGKRPRLLIFLLIFSLSFSPPQFAISGVEDTKAEEHRRFGEARNRGQHQEQCKLGFVDVHGELAEPGLGLRSHRQQRVLRHRGKN